MSFVSIDFLIFFPIVCIFYFIIPYKFKNFWLLCCSYFFYMCWNAKYAILMFMSIIITYGCGIGIEQAKRKGAQIKKTVLGIGLFFNFLILFLFKYFNFCFSTLDKLLELLNLSQTKIHINVPLPVGISFYTFQVVGYIIDVYRGDIKAEKNFIDFSLFVSFFPQLVAGPIERSKRLLFQIKERHKFFIDNFIIGIWYILYGFFLKVIIADRIALYVDLVYENLDIYQGLYVVIGTVLFAVQIYCDFSGYTTIAQGTAKILGFELIDNFIAPYFAVSVTDFWRRWHISLTSWFRDYLYIPLGGNRKGKLRKYYNTLLVFLCSGLWHGAAWGYIIWGGLNGVYLIVEEFSLPFRRYLFDKLDMGRATISHKIINIVTTFVLVDFSWIFFRSASISKALNAIKKSFSCFNPEILFDGSIEEMWISAGEILFLIIAVLVMVFVDYMKLNNISILENLLKQGFWFRCLLFVGMVMIVFLLGIYGGEYDASKFIYFQF